MNIVKRELTCPVPDFPLSASHVSTLRQPHWGCVACTALPPAWATPTACALAWPHPLSCGPRGHGHLSQPCHRQLCTWDTRLTAPTPSPFLTRATAAPLQVGQGTVEATQMVLQSYLHTQHSATCCLDVLRCCLFPLESPKWELESWGGVEHKASLTQLIQRGGQQPDPLGFEEFIRGQVGRRRAAKAASPQGLVW